MQSLALSPTLHSFGSVRNSLSNIKHIMCYKQPQPRAGGRARNLTSVAGGRTERYHQLVAKPKKTAIKRNTVRDGSLDLLDRIPLREGDEVLVSISEPVPARDLEALRRAAGAWKDIVDADLLIANIYADRLVATRPLPSV
jgi:hypothetical protein